MYQRNGYQAGTASKNLQRPSCTICGTLFTCEDKLTGSKQDLAPLIHELTGISILVIRGDVGTFEIDAEEKFSWMKSRQTKFEEDIACSILGLSGTSMSMSMLYVEGKENALRRLVKEIKRRENIRAPRRLQPLYSQPLGADQFRILHLKPGVVGNTIIGKVSEHNTSTPSQYYALSYVWGQEPSRTLADDQAHWKLFTVPGPQSQTAQHLISATKLGSASVYNLSRNQKQLYNAHGGTKVDLYVGRGVDGVCNGSLHTKGIIHGEISRRSTRFADATLTAEGLELVGTISPSRVTNSIHVLDAWRIIYADRDDKGEPAPPACDEAMTSILNTVFSGCDSISEQCPSLAIDIEELIMNIQTPGTVKAYLKVVRNIVWNRRFCQRKLSVSASNKEMENMFVGLVPQNANYGDSVCVLYGCSVPVVLWKSLNLHGEVHWQLTGEAYMDKIMDGEAVRSNLSEESLFEIR
ncbi:uncharacterized protein EAF01_010673 [Botrytis porri]|uniref:uncharacterized protein n=1 Tax=Botrytis porri TaxID=87229 RepID=UPI001900EBCE|nr:uncharacterized protein EAF01_010673 [Botrytis porri]KAF7890864.1 hypothetical protein EAF01_010673 [Botrytis porri]